MRVLDVVGLQLGFTFLNGRRMTEVLAPDIYGAYCWEHACSQVRGRTCERACSEGARYVTRAVLNDGVVRIYLSDIQ